MQELDYLVLALTPMERWSATRQLHVTPASDYWLPLVVGTVLLLLIVLLIGVSYRQRAESRQPMVSKSATESVRPEFSDRENEILLAVAVRSGVRRTQDIFASPAAFDEGARKLLAECVATRTPPEREQLNGEISGLRKKLGLPALLATGVDRPNRPSTRSIPVGERLQLMRAGAPTGLEGEVVRNDDIELALELSARVESKPGESWHLSYSLGMSVWEFDSVSVSCTDNRLILNHSSAVRWDNRRRFPRVEVSLTARIARLCFIDDESGAVAPSGVDAEALSAGTPTFVEARITELAGPGLRVETSLQVELNERVLVVFAPCGASRADVGPAPRPIAAAGRVRHCEATDTGLSVGIQLNGLRDDEVEQLVRITREIASRAGVANPAAPVAALT
jgi:hypothetical protein